VKQHEKTLSEKLIHKGRVITVYQEEVLLPNGKVSTRDIVRHKGACAILATVEDKIIMIKQYRKALDKVIYEIPAGGIEEGEDIALCAKRELNEETGYEAENLQYLAGMVTSPGFCDEVIHVYLAENVKKVIEKAPCDEDEFIEVYLIQQSHVEEMIRSGEIIDAKTICAYSMYKAMRS
jgi:ADP-ribose pyrophosphatase